MRQRLSWLLWRRYRAGPAGHRVRAAWSSSADTRCRFGAGVALAPNTEIHSSYVGDGTYVAFGTRVAGVTLGRYCSVGPRCLIGGLGVHPVDLLGTHPIFYSDRYKDWRGAPSMRRVHELPPTTIGSDVWIGAGAIVLDGVTIGDGAVVAAGAVVTKNVEPFAIVGGVPAKLIRYRFDAETRAVLSRLCWWDQSFATACRIAAQVAAGTLDVSNLAPLSAMICAEPPRANAAL